MNTAAANPDKSIVKRTKHVLSLVFRVGIRLCKLIPETKRRSLMMLEDFVTVLRDSVVSKDDAISGRERAEIGTCVVQNCMQIVVHVTANSS